MQIVQTARVEAPFVATERQDEIAHAWFDPAVRIVTAGGAIRSGKTQACSTDSTMSFSRSSRSSSLADVSTRSTGLPKP
jgi:hypothetical protein